MNLDLLASDIAQRVPAMAQDSTTNNAMVIRAIILRHLPTETPHVFTPFETAGLYKHYCEKCGFHRNNAIHLKD